MTSVYLHIPFCRRKCRYCAFDSWEMSASVRERYAQALQEEIRSLAPSPGSRLRTLFIGGGTPTMLSGALLREVVRTVKEIIPFDHNPEITVEANPGTVDESTLTILLEAGVNRLSLGVQSFHDRDLANLDRIHTAAEAREAYQAARKAGFSNINLDLMYGTPGQTCADWKSNLQQAIDLQPEHLSLYQLTVEEGTPLSRDIESGEVALPSAEVVVAMDEITENLCSIAALEQYEISNFARPGYRCRHNINYWQNREYLACGAAAVSYVGGRREKRVADPICYIELLSAGRSAIVEAEELSHEASFRETVILSLRQFDGLDMESLRLRFGFDTRDYYGATLERLECSGLVERNARMVRLTKKGRRLANIVLAELV